MAEAVENDQWATKIRISTPSLNIIHNENKIRYLNDHKSWLDEAKWYESQAMNHN